MKTKKEYITREEFKQSKKEIGVILICISLGVLLLSSAFVLKNWRLDADNRISALEKYQPQTYEKCLEWKNLSFDEFMDYFWYQKNFHPRIRCLAYDQCLDMWNGQTEHNVCTKSVSCYNATIYENETITNAPYYEVSKTEGYVYRNNLDEEQEDGEVVTSKKTFILKTQEQLNELKQNEEKYILNWSGYDYVVNFDIYNFWIYEHNSTKLERKFVRYETNYYDSRTNIIKTAKQVEICTPKEVR